MVLGMGSLATVPDTAGASGFNPMNVMNPSRWFGNNNRRYDDDYYGGPGYGYPPPPGYYPGAYGAPAYAPHPLYNAAPAAPAPAADNSKERIKELEDRIRQLEARQRQAPPSAPAYGGNSNMYPPAQQSGGYPQAPGGGYQPQTPGFRPLN